MAFRVGAEGHRTGSLSDYVRARPGLPLTKHAAALTSDESMVHARRRFAMNDQEREIIADIFRRLEQVANQPRDPEAERFIADRLRQQPYAPYAMAQAIFVQEQALARLQAENDQLRAELDHLSRQPQQGGILSGIFGGGARPPEPTYNSPPIRRASPWGSPQPMPQQPDGMPPQSQGPSQGPWGGGMAQPRGGGFLQGALSTAAG